MSKITITTTIDAPREAVWDLLTDFERMGEYSTMTGEIRDLSPTPVEAGTTWSESMPVGPYATTGEWEVTEFDRPHALRITGEMDSFEATVVTYLTAVDEDRTRLKEVIVYEFLPGRGVLAEFLDWAVVHRVLAREGIRSLANFRDLAEREAATGIRDGTDQGTATEVDVD